MSNSKLRIMIGNDDGINSMGVDILAKHANEMGEIKIICPERQMTAQGKGLTFHKPIRVKKTTTFSGLTGLAHNSTPALSLLVYQHLHGTPDAVFSGINSGENTSIHSILTSDTCALAMEGGIMNIPSFAFSIDVPESAFNQDHIPGDVDLAGKYSAIIAKAFLAHGSKNYWKNTLFINVNFPRKLNFTIPIVASEVETYKYDNILHEREDPRGEEYYWLWGTRRKNFNTDLDSSRIFNNEAITVSAISLNSSIDLYKETGDIAARIQLV
ncbi:MAG: hypothetical protein IH840_00365 [Candidatus Heimdallarchaeota archaeon]|nr:hypothetical protein [Candidatus Heimdallarchaeota archaeon]